MNSSLWWYTNTNLEGVSGAGQSNYMLMYDSVLVQTSLLLYFCYCLVESCAQLHILRQSYISWPRLPQQCHIPVKVTVTHQTTLWGQRILKFCRGLQNMLLMCYYRSGALFYYCFWFCSPVPNVNLFPVPWFPNLKFPQPALYCTCQRQSTQQRTAPNVLHLKVNHRQACDSRGTLSNNHLSALDQYDYTYIYYQ